MARQGHRQFFTDAHSGKTQLKVFGQAASPDENSAPHPSGAQVTEPYPLPPKPGGVKILSRRHAPSGKAV